MDYVSYDIGNSTNLYVFHSDLLRTTTIKVSFYTKMDHTEALKAVAVKATMEGSKNYPSKQELSMSLDREMGAELSVGLGKIGDVHNISFFLDALTDEQLISGRKTLENGLSIFNDVLFNPLEGKLYDKHVEAAKEKLIMKRERANMEPMNVAKRGFFELALGNVPFVYPLFGDVGEIEDVSSYLASEMMQHVLYDVPRNIFVITHLNPDYVRDLLGDFLVGPLVENPKVSAVPKKFSAEKSVPSKFGQTRVIVGYPFEVSSDFRLIGAMPILNNYLGGFSSSRLFEEIRVKRSLAYGANSNYDSDIGIIYGMTGIDGENIDLVVNLIKREFEKLSEGDIDWDMMWKAKRHFLSQMKMGKHIVASNLSLIERLILKDRLDLYPLFDDFAVDVKKSDVVNLVARICTDEPIVFSLMQGDDE